MATKASRPVIGEGSSSSGPSSEFPTRKLGFRARIDYEYREAIPGRSARPWLKRASTAAPRGLGAVRVNIASIHDYSIFSMRIMVLGYLFMMLTQLSLPMHRPSPPSQI